MVQVRFEDLDLGVDLVLERAEHLLLREPSRVLRAQLRLLVALQHATGRDEPRHRPVAGGSLKRQQAGRRQAGHGRRRGHGGRLPAGIHRGRADSPFEHRPPLLSSTA